MPLILKNIKGQICVSCQSGVHSWIVLQMLLIIDRDCLLLLIGITIAASLASNIFLRLIGIRIHWSDWWQLTINENVLLLVSICLFKLNMFVTENQRLILWNPWHVCLRIIRNVILSGLVLEHSVNGFGVISVQQTSEVSALGHRVGALQSRLFHHFLSEGFIQTSCVARSRRHQSRSSKFSLSRGNTEFV